ncbi:MAG: potassium-transporting ATPase potassium-binding subunit [Frankiaceae bacterium]|jgi:K+-transporting ATPase ATPase A chain|nr:potassium-transporting ATPase potassium-binding subunit [Frankiaceae bacterium]
MAGWAQLGLLVALLGVAWRPVGDYLARVYASERHWRAERVVYRVCGIDPASEQRWSVYGASLLAFSAVSVVLLFILQRVQPSLPLSLGHDGVPPALAFNTAVSFVTNTNWQAYAGESTMGHLVQMAGLAVQNFASAAVGLAVAVALIRGLARSKAGTIGNFWVDLVRGCVRVLLPFAFVAAVVLMATGVVQNLHGDRSVTTVTQTAQVVPGGPVASQEAIKELGTNGGGFYNANSAHPFENPTPLSNLVEMFLLLVIPFSLTRTFGVLVGDKRQGYAVLAVMALLWGAGVGATWAAERAGHDAVPRAATAAAEGKEVRFGVPASALFAASTTSTSTGAVIAAHDSFTSLGGGVLLFGMMLGEVTPGGVGSGLYGVLVLAILSVFIAGLMVGRTPEYLGKKITGLEIKLVSLYILVTPAIVLVGTSVAAALPSARTSLANGGPHGFSELLYAFTSAGNNNGSAFGGLNANTGFFNVALGVAMLLGRFLPIVLVLALAGALAKQQPVPVTAGTLPTHRTLFVGLLVGVILVVTGLTYFPALSLGPLAEGLR